VTRPRTGGPPLRYVLLLGVLTILSLPSGSRASTPAQAKHDRDVIRFFLNHPKQAATPEGQRVLWRLLHRLNERLRTLQAARADRTLSPHDAIVRVFGQYAAQALRVAACESGLSTRAQNGQYLGLFQMGEYARSRYGHSEDALGQARSAYRYFVDSGRDWSPWACRPW
jgi:hypothetical protein